MPRSSGGVSLPCIVWVFPQPVCGCDNTQSKSPHSTTVAHLHHTQLSHTCIHAHTHTAHTCTALAALGQHADGHASELRRIVGATMRHLLPRSLGRPLAAQQRAPSAPTETKERRSTDACVPTAHENSAVMADGMTAGRADWKEIDWGESPNKRKKNPTTKQPLGLELRGGTTTGGTSTAQIAAFATTTITVHGSRMTWWG